MNTWQQLLRLNFHVSKVARHTKSTIVLCYIKNDSRMFQILVANRIKRIESSPQPEQLDYVASKENPAYSSSRVMIAEQFKI